MEVVLLMTGIGSAWWVRWKNAWPPILRPKVEDKNITIPIVRIIFASLAHPSKNSKWAWINICLMSIRHKFSDFIPTPIYHSLSNNLTEQCHVFSFFNPKVEAVFRWRIVHWRQLLCFLHFLTRSIDQLYPSIFLGRMRRYCHPWVISYCRKLTSLIRF